MARIRHRHGSRRFYWEVWISRARHLQRIDHAERIHIHHPSYYHHLRHRRRRA